MKAKYLFSHEGWPALKRLAMDKALIALDFDGTLAPIVHQPPRARMPIATARELDRLCALAPVAIISGRELDDLERRVSAKARYLIGNHGNEGLDMIRVDAGACRDICADWMRQLQGLPELQAAGLHVESKGYTLSVHYRLSNDHPAMEATLPKVFAGLSPAPRVVGGKCVFDLIPPGAVCKNEAMEALVKQMRPRTVLYVGDDACDELVFTHAPPDWITIRVGYWCHSAAKYYLRYQREVRDLLLLINLQLGLAAADNQ